MTKFVSTRRRLALSLCLAAASSCAWGIRADSHAVPDPPDPAAVAAIPDVRHVAGANTGFAFRLLRRLIQDQPAGNVFLSPVSVSTALTMTLNGAGGQTQADMEKTLGLGPSDKGRLNHADGLLLSSLTGSAPDAQVAIANALWADTPGTFAPEFAEVCRQDYRAEATTLDLSSPDAAATINAWAARHTDGKIAHLVTREDIAGAVVVLTNAIYFHGKWQTPFNPAVTRDAPFSLDGSHTKNVPMMHQRGTLPYLEMPQYQAVALPYGGGRMGLCVLLPKPGVTVETVADGFTAHLWETAVAAMRPTSLALSLPRFQAGSETHLRKPLSDLGMSSAFGTGADFGPMGLPGTHLRDVIHQAMISVDEEGTEASAATVVIGERGISVTPVVVQVDRPFLIAIRDNLTGTLLFTGVIRDPKS